MSEEERLKLEDVITSDTGKALIKEIKYNELMQQRVEKLLKQNRELHSIIKEAREYIEEHTENIDRGRYYEDYVETYPILEILNKVGEE